MTVDWVSDLEAIAVTVVAAGVIALFVALRRQRKIVFEQSVIEVIEERTKQIQPEANGGKSLTDLHMKVDTLVSRQEEILNDVSMLKRAVVRIDEELEGVA